jgi:hypothetical protein
VGSTLVQPPSPSLTELCAPQGPADKDTKKKLKQKSSQEEEYELSRYKPLLRTVVEVATLSCASFIMLTNPFRQPLGPREQQTGYNSLPLCQRRALRDNGRRKQKCTNNTHNFLAQRKAKLAQSSTIERACRSTSACHGVRGRWDDVLRD